MDEYRSKMRSGGIKPLPKDGSIQLEDLGWGPGETPQPGYFKHKPVYTYDTALDEAVRMGLISEPEPHLLAGLLRGKNVGKNLENPGMTITPEQELEFYKKKKMQEVDNAAPGDLVLLEDGWHLAEPLSYGITLTGPTQEFHAPSEAELIAKAKLSPGNPTYDLAMQEYRQQKQYHDPKLDAWLNKKKKALRDQIRSDLSYYRSRGMTTKEAIAEMRKNSENESISPADDDVP